MSDLLNILCAVGGFAFGTLSAYINFRVSRRYLKADTVSAVMSVNFIRLLIDIVTLVIVFFVCRLAGLNLVVTLIAAALGLTIFGMLFLARLTKGIREGNGSKDGGE